MKNILKQFVAWVIRCKDKYKSKYQHDYFFLTRLKLTVSYTIGVFIIILFFSLAVYASFAKNISDNLEYDGSGEGVSSVELQIIDKAQDQLKATIITIDLLIILLIMSMSYYLAGETLKPIKISYNRQKNFIADTAHELRTPLAVMKTGAEANLVDGTDKERLSFIVDAVEEIDHLSAMVDDLLMLSKSDNENMPQFEKIDLGKLISKLTEHMKAYAERKNISLKTDIGNKCSINGNRVYLKRLLSNLIQNAIDYNKANGEVKIDLKKNDKQIELKVADTGVGISKKDLPNIFDRFYKVDEARTKSNGAGLGLSIVKKIVATHNGKITIESELGKHTTVTILFPCG